MCQEPTELLLIGFLIESILILRSKSGVLTPRTNPADILTKGSFSKDEWNNLLRLLNIVNLSHVFSQPFQSFCFRTFQKLETRVEKRAGAEFWWRFCHGKVETQWVLYRPRQGQEKFGVSSVSRTQSLSERTALKHPWKIQRKHWRMCLMLTGALGNRSMTVTQATMSSILKWENRKMFRAQRLGNKQRILHLTGAFETGAVSKLDWHKKGIS